MKIKRKEELFIHWTVSYSLRTTLHSSTHPTPCYSEQHVSITWVLVRPAQSASEHDARWSVCRTALFYVVDATAPLLQARNQCSKPHMLVSCRTTSESHPVCGSEDTLIPQRHSKQDLQGIYPSAIVYQWVMRKSWWDQEYVICWPCTIKGRFSYVQATIFIFIIYLILCF